MAWGIYYSASGGENFVYDNDIVVNKPDTASKVLTAAFYICGGPEYFGGQFFNNRITTNVPAAWIASLSGWRSAFSWQEFLLARMVVSARELWAARKGNLAGLERPANN